ncbi:hypothetical protein HDE_11597 [Halotydeus destructor]|nr:hypothetical protein HDE_11597 [Halotydeus destructor]
MTIDSSCPSVEPFEKMLQSHGISSSELFQFAKDMEHEPEINGLPNSFLLNPEDTSLDSLWEQDESKPLNHLPPDFYLNPLSVQVKSEPQEDMLSIVLNDGLMTLANLQLEDGKAMYHGTPEELLRFIDEGTEKDGGNALAEGFNEVASIGQPDELEVVVAEEELERVDESHLVSHAEDDLDSRAVPESVQLQDQVLPGQDNSDILSEAVAQTLPEVSEQSIALQLPQICLTGIPPEGQPIYILIDGGNAVVSKLARLASLKVEGDTVNTPLDVEKLERVAGSSKRAASKRKSTSKVEAEVSAFKKPRLGLLPKNEQQAVLADRLKTKKNPRGGTMRPPDVSKTKGKLHVLGCGAELAILEKRYLEITKTPVQSFYQIEKLTLEKFENEAWKDYEINHPGEDIECLRSDNRKNRRKKATTEKERDERLQKCNNKASVRSRIRENANKVLIRRKLASLKDAIKRAEAARNSWLSVTVSHRELGPETRSFVSVGLGIDEVDA